MKILYFRVDDDDGGAENVRKHMVFVEINVKIKFFLAVVGQLSAHGVLLFERSHSPPWTTYWRWTLHVLRL